MRRFLARKRRPGTVTQPPIPTSTAYWGARIDGAWYRDTAPSGYYTAQTNPDTGSHYSVTAPNADDAPWSAVEAGDGYSLFVAHAQKAPTGIHFGNSSSLADAFDTTAANDARSVGAFANYSLSVTTQELIDLANADDTRLALTHADTLASTMKTLGHPILLRPMWEMNGNFGWAWQTGAGITAAQYVAAWKALWKIFRARMTGTPLNLATGTTTGNVSFYWCANRIGGSSVDPTPFYPTDDGSISYVDWIGFDSYGHGNEGVSTCMDSTYAIVSALDTTKPIALGEVGASNFVNWSSGAPGTASTSPTKAQWITDFFTWLGNHPRVKFFSWFNEVGNPQDPHIEFGSAALTAFRSGITSSRFKDNIVNSTTFPSGAKIPIPS